jgi:mRNA-degrading endonuclease RelE of RelBE toxin-antitoxin system
VCRRQGDERAAVGATLVAYRVRYNGEAEEDMRRLTGQQRGRVRAAERRYLADRPDRDDGTIRKKLDPNPLDAEWELKLGELRVCYEVDQAAQVVRILRVLIKVREQ